VGQDFSEVGKKFGGGTKRKSSIRRRELLARYKFEMSFFFWEEEKKKGKEVTLPRMAATRSLTGGVRLFKILFLIERDKKRFFQAEGEDFLAKK